MKKWLRNRAINFTPIIYDLLASATAWLSAYWLRQGVDDVSYHIFQAVIYALPIVLVAQVIANLYYDVYRAVWQFSSLTDALRLIKATCVGIALSIVALFLTSRLQDLPRTLFPIYVLTSLFFIAGARFLVRYVRESKMPKTQSKRVLILGAGRAGESLVRDMRRDVKRQYIPIVFADDDIRKRGRDIHGIRVLGRCRDLKKYISKYQIDLIIIAMPSASSYSMQRIVNYCEQTRVPFQTLPGLSDLALGRVTINAIRQVSIADLLGRDQVKLDWTQIRIALENKTVLVTGAGGSIGSELCRQIAMLKPKKLICVDHSEFHLYSVEKELRHAFPKLSLSIELASVTDHIAMQSLMQLSRPQLVFHAAAYKHVPMLENQVRTAVHNNIFGTKIMADLSAEFKVEKFVLISTDKAVNPTNIMGTTKRIAELYCQNLDEHCETEFITVRFGNVLGSAGSVVPLFQEQLQRGGPLTVTHPDMTRYFMTIPEASQLILQAMEIGQGGEIFVLDMGEPITIQFLAEQMIRLAGKKVDEVKIVYTGLRPGEKLYEELFHQQENLSSTEHPKILKAQARDFSWVHLLTALNSLELLMPKNQIEEMLTVLKDLVPESQQSPHALPEAPCNA